jgi:hypothetical protein
VSGGRLEIVAASLRRADDGRFRGGYIRKPGCPGYLRVMFAADDIDETIGRLFNRGSRFVGEVVQYQDSYRLCSTRT